MSKESDLEQLRKRFQRGELSLDELSQEKARLGISAAPKQVVTRDYASSLKKLALVGGAIFAIAGVILGLTRVTSASLDCGSVFSPEPWSGIDLASNFAEVLCEDSLGSRGSVVWTLIVVGVLLMLVSFFPAKKSVPAPEPLRIPQVFADVDPKPEAKRSKSDQMDDLIELKESGALTEEQFQTAKDRILGKPAANAAQRAKLDELHESGVLSDADYVAAVDRLKGSE